MYANLVPMLWAAIAVVALPDALVAPDAHDPVYVAANVFVFFAALLLLSHVYGKSDETRATPAAYAPAPPAAYALLPPALPPHTHDDSICCERNKTHARARTELIHLFVHVLCLAYVRTACWFEFRYLAAALARPV